MHRLRLSRRRDDQGRTRYWPLQSMTGRGFPAFNALIAAAEVRTVGTYEHRARGAVADHVEALGQLVPHLDAEAVLRRVVADDGREIVFNSVTKMRHGFSLSMVRRDVRGTRVCETQP